MNESITARIGCQDKWDPTRNVKFLILTFVIINNSVPKQKEKHN